LNSRGAIGQCHGLEFRLQAVAGNDQPDRLKAELQTKNDIVLSVAVPGRSRCIEISRIYVAEAPHRA